MKICDDEMWSKRQSVPRRLPVSAGDPNMAGYPAKLVVLYRVERMKTGPESCGQGVSLG